MNKINSSLKTLLILAGLLLVIEIYPMLFGIASTPRPFDMPAIELLALFGSILVGPLSLISWGLFITLKSRIMLFISSALSIITVGVFIKFIFDVIAEINA